MRASDADRDRVVALLQQHHAAGRLTAEEFDQRVDAALAARTLGELDELLADLPHTDVRDYRLPDADLRRPSSSRQLPDAGIKPPRDRLYIPGGQTRVPAAQFAKDAMYRVNSPSARRLFFSRQVSLRGGCPAVPILSTRIPPFRQPTQDK